MRVALIGYGNVGKAFARLLGSKHSSYPFRIVAIHTARHGTAYDSRGLSLHPEFGAPAASIEEFLDRARADVAVEITTLNPEGGEPAVSHIKAALGRHIHVITANKGPIANAYAELSADAKMAQVEFRFESTVMDGTPIFNNVRNNLPGVKILGFTGVLNSTSKIVLAAMKRGLSLADGIKEAQTLGIAEADPSYDLEGWDAAAKAAAIANVLMDARATPSDVERRGIGDITPDDLIDLAQNHKTMIPIARGELAAGGLRLQVRPEVVDDTDLLAGASGSSNLLLLHTDLMGTIGIISINPGVDQTAYGLFSDLIDIAKSL
ncbi:MAG: hypothetical protein JO108_03460 [Acidobacteriaceae bacterium]|nr:hypothetical protein [Acidobacteriaceae bacterium]